MTITTESLRTDNAAAARQRLCDMLSSPAEYGDVLLGVMSDRGLRDALLAAAVQTGRMDALYAAAEVALRVAADDGTGTRSPYGPLTVAAVAAWVGGLPEYAAELAAQVPEGDPAHRMASLVTTLIERGIPADRWLQLMERTDLESCLQFRG